MPPPRINPFSLFQSPHPTSFSSSPRVIHSNRYHNLFRHQGTFTRPTRPQHHHRQQQQQQSHNATHPFPLHNQSFSTSTISRRDQNYYEILDLPITASAAEIKKKFYALSLRHHPDRNRHDPTASARFAKISSAYSVLSNPQKRSTYDRDHGFHHAHHAHPQGSHSSHSANLHKGGGGRYAGSRPASGLSKRRGTFHGPPPSFYAQGGYGATGRREEGYAAGKAGPEGAGSTNAADGRGGGFGNTSTGTGAAGAAGQADPEDPLGFIDRNPLGHFNARGHFRTQKAEDERRRERASRARNAAREKSDSFVAGGAQFGLFRFVVVCGILVTAGAMTGLLQWPVVSSASSEDGGKTGKKRKDTVSVPVSS